MVILVLEGSLFLGPVVVLKLDRFKLLVDQIHEVFPDLSRPGRALQSAHRFGRITADPDRGRIIMGESAEPAVLGVVCRTGLSCGGHSVVEPEAAAGSPSFFKNALHYADHLSGCVLVIDLGRCSVVAVNRSALVILDRSDAGRNTVFAVIEKCSVAGCHLYRLNTVCESAKAGCQRVVRIHDHGKVHALELGKTVPGRNIIIDLPGDCVEGSLHSLAQLEFAHVAAAGVFGSVLDLLVLHQRSGIVTPLKRRRIDHQRLDGTTGLPVALESAVERQAGVQILLRPAAYHGDDLSGAVVDTYSGALQLVFAVIRCICEIFQCLVDAVLQLLLFLHIKGRMDPVSAFIELGQAGVVQLIVDLVISRALFIAREVVPEGKVRVLKLHEHFSRALIGIREHIRVLIELSVIIG